MIHVDTENDIERLRAYARCAEKENRLLRTRLSLALTRLAEAEGVEQQSLLLEEIKEINKALGSTSPLESASERRGKKAKNGAEGPPQRGHGPREQPSLPIREEVHLLEEADQVCPKCGEALHPIEGQFEESELIDLVDVKYELRKILRQKYRCTDSACQHIDTALPTDDRLMPGGRYSIDFAVHVIDRKYNFHMPLTRQAKSMKADGLAVSSNTLWDLIWHSACLLEPTWQALRDHQLQQSVMGADESRWRLLDKKGKAKPQIIGLTTLDGVYYDFRMDKRAETVSEVLGDFAGMLVVDGISIYPAVRQRHHDGHINGTRDGPAFQIANCWVHARRNFIKAEVDFVEASEMLDMIARLYQIVGAAEEAGLPDDERNYWVDGALAAIKEWLVTTRPLPGSSLEQAIGYMDKHWKGLTVFRDRREVWLDNNATERALRAPILGRKNHYGSKSKRGMKAAAILYSLIETCELIGVGPKDYLSHALRTLSRKPGRAFLPHEMLDD